MNIKGCWKRILTHPKIPHKMQFFEVFTPRKNAVKKKLAFIARAREIEANSSPFCADAYQSIWKESVVLFIFERKQWIPSSPSLTRSLTHSIPSYLAWWSQRLFMWETGSDLQTKSYFIFYFYFCARSPRSSYSFLNSLSIYVLLLLFFFDFNDLLIPSAALLLLLSFHSTFFFYIIRRYFCAIWIF